MRIRGTEGYRLNVGTCVNLVLLERTARKAGKSTDDLSLDGQKSWPAPHIHCYRLLLICVRNGSAAAEQSPTCDR